MSYDTTITHQANLTVTTCISCGTVFAMDGTLYAQQAKFGGYHYCPNGHSQGWAQRDSQSAADKREAENARLKSAAAYHQERAEEARKQAVALKGKITKLEKRVSNGVCPCCQRTFKQLAAHMKNKHPQFVEKKS